MKEAMPSLNNISWERLEKESSVTYPCNSPNSKGEEIVFGDKFPTTDGRGKFVFAKVVPPAEVPDDKFPIVSELSNKTSLFRNPDRKNANL